MHTPSPESLSFERGTQWSAAFDKNCPSLFTLKRDKQDILELSGVALGSYAERSAISDKFRRHEHIHLGAASVDASCVIPFGAEPRISREVAFVANHATITTDIDTRGKFPGRSISVDTFLLPLPQRIGILEIPAPGSQPVWRWQDCNPFKKFAAETPFLSCLCEYDQFSIEISTGFDLWRWAQGPSLGAKSSFSFSKENGKLKVSRLVCEWPEAEGATLPSRQWRFRWHLAWLDKSEEVSEAKSGSPTIFELASENWPENALSAIPGEETPGAPCWLSGPVGKRLKGFIRSAAAGQQLVARISGPQLCENAGHLERPGKEKLLHWDISSLLDFWHWANRQLAEKDSRFTFALDPSHPCASLPSLKGISR